MLDAAVAVFAERGYRAASMDDIAERAGVSKPLVYLYLNSKEELFGACVRREADALVAAVREAAGWPERREALPADQRLWNGLRGFFAHTARRPDGWIVLHRQARTNGEPFASAVEAVRGEVLRLVTELIALGAREAGCGGHLVEREVSGLAHALVGAAESLVGWADEGPGRDPAVTLMNFAWTGLENVIAGHRWQRRD
ncbi:TetR/AcrR family transcriptional regulator [Streptomyces sp. URMC 123]|uniref:TetR/AcrR family transcriptional regulator n=1 Tax=Streptomyces sp. URMC 123 TaxID=3423403 RepID=UPI003F1C5C16